MKNNKVYAELITAIEARKNCIKSNNQEWIDKWEDKIDNIVKNYLPHGSGIDNGCQVDLDKSNDQKLIIYSANHNMNEAGFYNGWTNFTVNIIPSLMFGFKLNIVGNFSKSTANYGLKDDLYEVFDYALNLEVKED